MRIERLLAATRCRRLVPRLLAWFARDARQLPWRRTRDPYAIWVSEVMLQQTQVKTVIPYWSRWMRALPTIEALARARPAQVLKLWEGLGYYTRARNLHRAAKVLRAKFGGRFPADFSQILALPGVGRYTAGALCSIAFNQPRPVLDGNVSRVLTRVFGIEEPARTPKVTRRLWRLAEMLVQQAAAIERPGQRHCAALNQALMELGAVLCTPRTPRCAECPVKALCHAHKLGRAERLPRLGPRSPAVARHVAAFVVEHRGRFLVRQRAHGGLNARLWEFPNTEASDDRQDPAALAAEVLGMPPVTWRHLARLKHSITRFRITLDVYDVQLDGPPPARRPEERWLTLAQLDRLAFAAAHRRIVQRLHLASATRTANLRA